MADDSVSTAESLGWPACSIDDILMKCRQATLAYPARRVEVGASDRRHGASAASNVRRCTWLTRLRPLCCGEVLHSQRDQLCKRNNKNKKIKLIVATVTEYCCRRKTRKGAPLGVGRPRRSSRGTWSLQKSGCLCVPSQSVVLFFYLPALVSSCFGKSGNCPSRLLFIFKS